MLQRGLGIEDKQTGIETVNQKELGILYHRILEGFFGRLREEGGVFSVTMMDDYRRRLGEETDRALAEARKREGAFQEPVYDMLRPRVLAALTDFLELQGPFMNGAEIIGCELELRKEEPQALLAGRTDLVLKQPDGRFIILDFKAAVLPSIKELVAGEDGCPVNAQMAAYTIMLEAVTGGKVAAARFCSLDNRKDRKVIDDDESVRFGLPKNRDHYQEELDAVERAFAGAVEAVQAGNYAAPGRDRRQACGGCRVRAVCRMTYTGGETR
jgi:hypothetical protein